MIKGLADTLVYTLSSALINLQFYLPRFLAGLVLLLIGLFASKVAKRVVLTLLKALRVGPFLVQVKVVAEEGAFRVWETLLAELARWTVMILFLIPAVEAWGLPRVTDILNSLLLYLPNVFVGVIVGLVGFVVANLTSNVVTHGASGLDLRASKAFSGVAYYAILFFTALVVLNQLGVASDLIRILFTGFVAMMALAGGLAFGLGGKEIATEILRALKTRLTK